MKLIPRDDLALAAMHGRRGGELAGAAAHHARRAAAADRGAAAAAPGRRFDAYRAQAREWFTKTAVAFGNQQRQTEHAAPGLPLGDDVIACGRGKQRQRQSWIVMFENDGD